MTCNDKENDIDNSLVYSPLYFSLFNSGKLWACVHDSLDFFHTVSP